MNKLNKTTILLAVSLTALLSTGCGEHIEREKFEVKTVDGKVLTFACPLLNLERSSLSYIYDGDCVITNVDEVR